MDWLEKNPANQVVFSFGEADELIRLDFENETFDHPDRVYQVQPESINDFKNQLNRGVSCILGKRFWSRSLGGKYRESRPICMLPSQQIQSIWRPTGPQGKCS